MRHQRKKFLSTSIGTFLILGILIILNAILQGVSLRFDATHDKVFSLSVPTKEMLQQLDDPVNIKAYLTENLPAESNEFKVYMESMLKEYKAYGLGKIRVEFINPNTSQEKEMEAQKAGLQPIQFNKLENDSFVVKRGYLGLEILYGEQKEIIPVVTSTRGFEYELTRAIKKLTSKDLPTIGFIQGYGAPTLSGANQAASSIEFLVNEVKKSYHVTTVNLTSTENIPDEVSTLVMSGLKEDIPQEQKQVLESFIERGGNLLVAQGSADINVGNGLDVKPLTLPVLKELYDSVGVHINEGLIADPSNQRISVATQNGFITMQQLVQFPLIPLIKELEDSPITMKVSPLVLPFVSSLTIDESIQDQAKTLVYSSNGSATFTNLTNNIDIFNEKFFFPPNTEKGHFPLAVSIENDNGAHHVFIGSHSCILDQVREVSCIKFFLNAIDWSLQDPRLIAVRNKGFEARFLKETSNEEKLTYKIIIMGLPTLIILLFGIIYWRKRSARAKKIYTSHS